MNRNHDWRHIYRTIGMKRDAFIELVRIWYTDEKMSGVEISERILREHGIIVTPRSIQRTVKSLGISRQQGDAYRMAASKGRMRWEKSNKPKIMRKRLLWRDKMPIIKRDKFTCVDCGFHHQDDSFQYLTVDHKVPLALGGAQDESNMQTLCVECHGKKTIADRKAILDSVGGAWKRGGCYSGREIEMRKKI